MISSIRCVSNVQYSLGDARLIEALDLLRAALRDHLTHRAHLIQASSEILFQEHV